MLREIRKEAAKRLTPSQRETLECIESWDLSGPLRRAQTRMGWSTPYAKQIEHEYRKFIALLVVHPEKTYGMAGAVDELWHDHILSSVDYINLCRAVAGRYLHHMPTDDDHQSICEADYYQLNTIPDMSFIFKGAVNKIWPKGPAEQVAKCSGGKCCGGHVSDLLI